MCLRHELLAGRTRRNTVSTKKSKIPSMPSRYEKGDNRVDIYRRKMYTVYIAENVGKNIYIYIYIKKKEKEKEKEKEIRRSERKKSSMQRRYISLLLHSILLTSYVTQWIASYSHPLS